MSFSSMHNDYLDPDLHGCSQDDFQEYEEEQDQSDYTWHFYELSKSEKKLIDIYGSPERNNALACDMHDWMVENGYYGENNPEDYDWDGDGEYVAIMGKKKEMTDYCFEWKKIEEDF